MAFAERPSHDTSIMMQHQRISQLHRAYLSPEPGEPVDETITFEWICDALSTQPKPSSRQLRRLRRIFAARNHPDRAPSHLRERALSEMAAVNSLIDRALRDQNSA